MVRSQIVKALEDSVLFIKDGMYTTCTCIQNPSYSFRSDKMKLVDQKWIYTGPLQLYIYNIPTPLWLPFGFLPAQDARRSGPLPPSYGEDEFGFYMRNFGWYFALSEYMDLQLQAGFWTNASWEIDVLFRYKQRYTYDGQLGVSFARFKNGEKGDPDYSIRDVKSLRWLHSQTIGASASLNAKVNLSSEGYLRGVSQSYDDRTRQNIQSTIRYSKRWKNQNLSVQVDQNQIVETGRTTANLPTLSFSQSSFKPLSRSNRSPGQSEKFYEKFTVSYNLNVTNRFEFNPLSDDDLIANGDSAAIDITWLDALFSADDYQRATGDDEPFQFRAAHTIPLSAPFSVSRLPLLGSFDLNLSPSIRYNEDWFARTERRSLSADSSKIDVSSEQGFFALRQFRASLSASSTFYGLLPINLPGYNTIRHTVRPSLTYSYRPDFYDEKYGYTRTYTDANGNEVRYGIVPGVSRTELKQITFAINNTFETKRVRRPDDFESDSRRPQGAVKLLDLNISSGYNFAADSLKFRNILLTARTRLFGNTDFNVRTSFSPYELSDTGQLTDKYAFSFPGILGRLTRADVTVRTSLRSKRGDGSRPYTSPRAGYDIARQDPFREFDSYTQSGSSANYADFSIPWSMTLDFTYGVSKVSPATIKRAIINGTFDFSLTPNWKIASRTGYDFERREIVTTNLAIARDFDCWQMSVFWVPFGAYESWGFEIHVKSDILRDFLKLEQPKKEVSNQFGLF
ncbi:MAG: LPS-assembly protein LptD [Bacteroidetes bacterium]|nr:MAG: LPS-assembly protein LptD [Bacteroidota bacterium]